MRSDKSSKINFIKYNYAYIILSVILSIEIFFLIFLNFFYMGQMVDYDSSGAFVHAIEIWKQHNLFLQEYNYATTADIDSMVGIVAFLFGITKNIFISQAIGNCIVILFFLYLIFRLLKAARIKREVRVAVEVLLFIPYSWGQLGYISLLFTNSACNSIRYVMPILLLSVIMSIEVQEKVSKYIGRIVLLLIISFFVGLSSGLYVLFCGIFPFFVAEIIHMICKGDWKELKNRRLIVISLALFFCVLGYVFEGSFGLTNKANSITLMDENSFIDWISISFIGIYQLFGGIANVEGIALMSAQAIRVVLNGIIATISMGAVVYSIVKLIKKKFDIPNYSLYALSVFVINETALLILKTSYGGGLSEFRYHIMSLFALLILLADFVNDIIQYKNVPLRQMTLFIMIGVISISSMGNLFGYFLSLKKNDITLYKNLQAACEKYNISSLLFYGESQVIRGRVARAFLEDVNCIITGDDWKNIAPTIWGGSFAGLDHYAVGEQLYIFCEDGMIEKLPSYLYNDIVLCENYENYNLYAIDTNSMDFVSGYSSRRSTKDFPYSPGYLSEENIGMINEDGVFVSNGNGGIALKSQEQTGVDGVWNVTLHYKVISYGGEDNASISVVCNGGQEMIATEEISIDKSECTISNMELVSNMRDIQNQIYIPKGMYIEINDITMELLK